MFICTFKYTPETVDCKYCLLYCHRRCTAKNGCPYLAERIEAGAVDYATIVRDEIWEMPTCLPRQATHHNKSGNASSAKW